MLIIIEIFLLPSTFVVGFFIGYGLRMEILEKRSAKMQNEVD